VDEGIDQREPEHRDVEHAVEPRPRRAPHRATVAREIDDPGKCCKPAHDQPAGDEPHREIGPLHLGSVDVGEVGQERRGEEGERKRGEQRVDRMRGRHRLGRVEVVWRHGLQSLEVSTDTFRGRGCSKVLLYCKFEWLLDGCLSFICADRSLDLVTAETMMLHQAVAIARLR
jgi:hypothetical protein